MASDQLPLFESPMEDRDDFAQHIAEHARQVDYPDRTSDAARDQGWGPLEMPSPLPFEATVPAQEPVAALRRPVVELPRPGYDNNPLSGLTPAKAREGMTEAEIDAQDRANGLGFAAARTALNQSQK